MFFRIVTSKYKKKKYHYLRVMESYRKGTKVKQKELITLANLSRLPAEKIQLVMSELKFLQNHCSSLNEHTDGITPVSLLVALEMVFQPKRLCPLAVVQQIMKKELEKKAASLGNPGGFFELLRKHYPPGDESPELILYTGELLFKENTGTVHLGYLIDSDGFPLNYFIFGEEPRPDNLHPLAEEICKAHNAQKILLFTDNNPDNGSKANIIPFTGHRSSSRPALVPEPVLTLDAVLLPQKCPAAMDFIRFTPPPAELLTQISRSVGLLYWSTGRIKNIGKNYINSVNELLDMCIISVSLSKLIETRITEKYALLAKRKMSQQNLAGIQEPEDQQKLNP
ncbi:hypothetical protein DCCM_2129 [Desulfocucumis palustris]|uniref:Uncharacterized protein n=1 Tax=Desulfocucumis palustris TaxID=1898651 RepID=A0A2L2XAF0_9FIRM|nr:hypothetical protein [Desulfocucumis palustris]GBF33032.1 hypothetical protein DCCM_2129 [Desulfocucumis palustris]